MRRAITSIDFLTRARNDQAWTDLLDDAAHCQSSRRQGLMRMGDDDGGGGGDWGGGGDDGGSDDKDDDDDDDDDDDGKKKSKPKPQGFVGGLFHGILRDMIGRVIGLAIAA